MLNCARISISIVVWMVSGTRAVEILLVDLHKLNQYKNDNVVLALPVKSNWSKKKQLVQ